DNRLVANERLEPSIVDLMARPQQQILDGHRLQENLLDTLPQGSPLMDRTAQLLQEVVGTYSDARSRRRTMALWSGNRPDRNDG
ncbi:MAG: hypothetical protein J0H50_14765, partial [Xanthomonadales bacterium]|nr:hypothetical protein [Xanthomonadales bacterium]